MRKTFLVATILAAARIASAQIAEFPLASDASPGAITAGPDGNVWFTQRGTQSIGRITPGGAVATFSVGSAQPEDIVAGPDGRMWYTTFLGDRVGSVDPLAADVGASVIEVVVAGAGSRPAAIVPGGDGALWFTQARGDQIGRMTTAGALTNEFATPGRIPIDVVAVGLDLWFTLFDTDQIARITTGGAIGPTYDLPAGTRPQSIALGADGALWFTAPGRHVIGRITVDGSMSEFPLDAGSQPNVIVAGPDGALWFTLFEANRIGRVSTAGEVGGIDLPNPDSGPDGITVGPDGNLWFTETIAGRIGRMAPALPTTTTTTTLLAGPCGPVVTIAQLECRLGLLVTRLGATAELGALQAKVVRMATAARTQAASAGTRCAAGKARPAKIALKKSARKAGAVTKRLRSKRAGRTVPSAVAESFIAEANVIVVDLRSLGSTLVCALP